MKGDELLDIARTRFQEDDAWVEAIVLRRYRDGRPETSFRIDKISNRIDVPEGFTHALVIIEVALVTLLEEEATRASA